MNRQKVLLVGWGTETAKYMLTECVKLENYDFYLATTAEILPEIKRIFNKGRLLITNPYDEKILCEDVEKYCQANQIMFDIITTFFEMCVYQTAFLVEYMGVKNCLPLRSALKTSVNKYLMRVNLQKNGVKQPKFFKFSKNSIDEAFEFFNKNCKKAIIKPVHSGHSYGVRFLETGISLDKFKECIEEAMADYKESYDEWMKFERVDDLEFLLEEFIEGKIFSFDGFADGNNNNNKVEFIGTTEFELSNPPVMQQIGHTSPIYSLTKKQLVNGKNYVKKIVKVLGLKYCGFHCELKFCGSNPYLIEISGRLPGAMISRTYQNLSEYNLFDRFFGIFSGNRKFSKNKEHFRSESMKIVFAKRVVGVVRGGGVGLGKINGINLCGEVRSRKEGEFLLGGDNPFGVWLYDIDIKSKNLSAGELLKEKERLIDEQNIRVEENWYLYVRQFFNTIKDVLKKYV